MDPIIQLSWAINPQKMRIAMIFPEMDRKVDAISASVPSPPPKKKVVSVASLLANVVGLSEDKDDVSLSQLAP